MKNQINIIKNCSVSELYKIIVGEMINIECGFRVFECGKLLPRPEGYQLDRSILIGENVIIKTITECDLYVNLHDINIDVLKIEMYNSEQLFQKYWTFDHFELQGDSVLKRVSNHTSLIFIGEKDIPKDQRRSISTNKMQDNKFRFMWNVYDFKDLLRWNTFSCRLCLVYDNLNIINIDQKINNNLYASNSVSLKIGKECKLGFDNLIFNLADKFYYNIWILYHELAKPKVVDTQCCKSCDIPIYDISYIFEENYYCRVCITSISKRNIAIPNDLIPLKLREFCHTYLKTVINPQYFEDVITVFNSFDRYCISLGKFLRDRDLFLDYEYLCNNIFITDINQPRIFIVFPEGLRKLQIFYDILTIFPSLLDIFCKAELLPYKGALPPPQRVL